MAMEYRERDNQIFRGVINPEYNSARMTEWLVNNEWQPVEGDFGTKAGIYGTKMTEPEAREFHGEGWPEETAEAPPAAQP